MEDSAAEPDESYRLAELERLNAMENVVEKTYGDITRLAASICETPIAAITLVDGGRQWFMSAIGITATNTPRAIAFCHHTIAQDEVFVVDDASVDPRFKDNPLVRGELQMNFYAGAPLKTSKGFNIGALCVIDRTKRHLNKDQIFLLKVLARLVTLQLESTLNATNMTIMLSRLQGFLDHLSFGILIENRERKVEFVNNKFCLLFAVPNRSSELLGRDCPPIYAETASFMASPERYLDRIELLVDRKEGVIGEELVLKDGRILERDYIPTIVRNNYEGHIWIYRDVTEKKETARLLDDQKAKLAMAAKMASLGEMAAGIAHEINNPLAIVHARSHYLRMLAMKGQLDTKLIHDTAESIEETSERMAKIIRGLQAFARDDGHEPFVSASLQHIMEEVLLFCQSRFSHHGVRLDVPPFPEDTTISCRPVPLSQVLLNLLNNAFDAVMASPAKWIRIEVQNKGDRIAMEISDSGPGIPENIRDDIMRPFFTTKEIGKGSGLGLSISKGIVESHGGSLYLKEGSPNTCFVVDLPKGHGRSDSQEVELIH